MKLFTRLALFALVLASTPVAAKSSQDCPGSQREAAFVPDTQLTMACLASAKSTPTKQSPGAVDRCTAASAHDPDSLVELHRSIRDGGLGVLRRPSNVSDTTHSAARRAGLAGCRVG
jgi:hypothetical protein